MYIQRLIYILIFLTSSVSDNRLDAQENQYVSVSSHEVHPGVTYTVFETTVPQRIHVLAVSLRDSLIRIGTFRAESLRTVSFQFDSLKRIGCNPVAGINADFFDYEPGVPVGNQVKKGRIINSAKTNRTHFGRLADGRFFMDRTSFVGKILNELNDTLLLDGYNSRGRSINTVLFDSVNFNLPVGKVVYPLYYDSATARRETLWAHHEESTVTKGQSNLIYLLVSASEVDKTREFLRKSQNLRITLGFANLPEMPEEMIGGLGRILKGGVFINDSLISIDEGVRLEFFKARHPRTFAAIDQDTTKLFLCVVDGRSDQSAGMDFKEMASFLSFIGGSEGINFDGGGSSTMVIWGKVVNSPSDKTGERPCANVVFDFFGTTQATFE